MFPLTHVVLGGGAVWAAARLTDRLRQEEGSAGKPNPRRPASGDAIDYRLVAAGALLADVVDKPLGVYLLRSKLGSGHIYGHTLAFSLSLVLPGLLLARRGRHRLLSLALGSLTHILVDPIIRSPRIFFWPLGGFRFPRERVEGWGRRMLRRCYSDPRVVLSEGTAAMALLGLAGHLWRRRRLGRFLRSGRL